MKLTVLAQMSFALVAAGLLARADAAASPVLVPAPQEMKVSGGEFVLKTKSLERSHYAYRSDASLPKEGYWLSVGTSGIAVSSSDEAGRFYAEQTLRQLGQKKGDSISFPCVEIKDFPAYPWRGALLDEGRHFFGRETVKDMLDLMAYHKMNVLHWHLTEDQGWRIDIPGMPELVK